MDNTYMNKYPLVHILPQKVWHDDAVIIGNKDGLRALRNVITEALASAEAYESDNSCATEDFYCADGEGYTIGVALRKDMSDAPLGYTCESARDSTYPEWLVEAVVNSRKKKG